jgi:hypothetical protein
MASRSGAVYTVSTDKAQTAVRVASQRVVGVQEAQADQDRRRCLARWFGNDSSKTRGAVQVREREK